MATHGIRSNLTFPATTESTPLTRLAAEVLLLALSDATAYRDDGTVQIVEGFDNGPSAVAFLTKPSDTLEMWLDCVGMDQDWVCGRSRKILKEVRTEELKDRMRAFKVDHCVTTRTERRHIKTLPKE